MYACNGITKSALSYQEAYNKLFVETNAGSYTSYLRGKRCYTEDDFLREVSASFQFPYYFGENWPAFDECIQDLDWLNFSRIFVLFDDFSQAFSQQKDIQTLLQKRVVEYWERAIEYWALEGKTVEVWLNN